MDYDLIVIGGGAAGLGAAQAGRWAGAEVLMVNDGPPGGECTFTGCVPSKTLLAAARDGLDFRTAMTRVQNAIDLIASAETASELRGQGIDFIEDRARLVTHDSIAVGDRRISGRRIVVATGTRPAIPPIEGLDRTAHLTNENVFDLDTKPESLAIVGGGAIGCEMAQAMGRFGIRVHLFETAEQLLPLEEPEAGAVVEAVLERGGVDVATGTRILSIDRSGDGSDSTTVSMADRRVEVAHVLVATGRRPMTEGLALDEIGVELDERGYVRVDDRMATTVKGVFAAGDVTGRLPFTHAAFEMGRLAAANALGKGHRGRFRAEWVPWTTFTDPEVSRVGLTEAESVEKGGRVAYLPLTAMDRAITDGRTDGYVKLIAGPKVVTRRLFGGRIIGATIVAPRAGEMIHEPALAMRAGLYTGRLAQLVHAYPTWSIGVRQAAAQFFGEVDGRTARPAASDSG